MSGHAEKFFLFRYVFRFGRRAVQRLHMVKAENSIDAYLQWRAAKDHIADEDVKSVRCFSAEQLEMVGAILSAFLTTKPKRVPVDQATVRNIHVDMHSDDRLGGTFTYHGEPRPDAERLNVPGTLLTNWPTIEPLRREQEDDPQPYPPDLFTEEERTAMRSEYEATGLGFCSRCAAYNETVQTGRRLDALVLYWLWGIPVAESLRLRLLPECHLGPWDRRCQCVKEDKQCRRDEAEAERVKTRRAELKTQAKGGRPPKHADHAARQRAYRGRVSSRSPKSIGRVCTLKVHRKVLRLEDEPVTYRVASGTLDAINQGVYLTDAPKGQGLLMQELQTVEYINDEHDE